MKTIILLCCLISTIAVAQNSASAKRIVIPNQSGQEEPLGGNYLLKLVVTDKEKPVTEINVVIATTRFQAAVGDPILSLSGTISAPENGTMMVCYMLNTQVAVPTQTTTPTGSGPGEAKVSTIEYKSSAVQASVLLGMGQSVQILKTGSRSYELSITPLVETSKKEK